MKPKPEDLSVRALVYAQRGWPVLPCQPGTKTPATRHGLHDASIDPDQIASWWRRQPDANIAIATGLSVIDAYVTQVSTDVPASGIRYRGDLLMKSYERIFMARVPLPASAHAKISFTNPWSYAELGEGVEAWGFRCMQAEGAFIDREQVARRWFAEEFTPVVRMLRAADLVGAGTDAEAYQRLAREKYRLMRTHEWSDDIIERLRREVR